MASRNSRTTARSNDATIKLARESNATPRRVAKTGAAKSGEGVASMNSPKTLGKIRKILGVSRRSIRPTKPSRCFYATFA
jgi:hypothetical protein